LNSKAIQSCGEPDKTGICGGSGVVAALTLFAHRLGAAVLPRLTRL
jgi:hypothetical protein